jgi:hypothetical protein
MFAHAFIDTDPDGKTIIRANTETHSGHTLVPAVVSLRTVIRLADQLGLIILDPELIQEGDRGEDHRPRLHLPSSSGISHGTEAFSVAEDPARPVDTHAADSTCGNTTAPAAARAAAHTPARTLSWSERGPVLFSQRPTRCKQRWRSERRIRRYPGVRGAGR